jgi:hypothetical protein
MGANLCEPHHQYLDVVLGVQLRLCNNIVFCIIVPVLVYPFITFVMNLHATSCIHVRTG